MSAVIDDNPASTRRAGLAGGFAGGATGAGPDNPKELSRRLWFTLGALISYRMGSHLPLPGLDMVAWQELLRGRSSGTTVIVGLLDMLAGGGAVIHLSIFALGVIPYISAFIVVELASRIVPQLSALAANGSTGRRKLNQYARMLTIAFAALQAVGVALGLESLHDMVVAPGFLFELTTIVTLTAGAVLVMWLAEQITARGIGSGVLVIIACGIVSQLPFNVGGAIESVRRGDVEAIWLMVAVAMVVAVIALVVVAERAKRWISTFYPKSSADKRYAHISLKLNSTGVLAPIAAGVLAAPLSGIIASVGHGTLLYREFAIGGIGHLSLDALLIVLFAVFFGLAIFNADETARKLKDSHGFVPGFRPGEMTARHLWVTQTVLVTIGAAYLVTVCVLPDLFYRWTVMSPLFGGYQLFLLAWLAVHTLEQIRPFVRR